MLNLDQAADIVLADFDDPMIHYFAKLVFSISGIFDEAYTAGPSGQSVGRTGQQGLAGQLCKKHNSGWRESAVHNELVNVQLHQLTGL